MGDYESDNSRLMPYLFIVELDGIQTMWFQKCEGLEAETEVFEYQEGGGAVHKFKGRTRFPNIVLEKASLTVMTFGNGTRRPPGAMSRGSQAPSYYATFRGRR